MADETQSRWRRMLRSKRLWIISGVVVLLVVVRAVLPIFIERYIDRSLDNIEGYTGNVQDVDLNLFRGAYVIEGTHIRKTGTDVGAPLLRVPRVDISVQWSALLDGAIVAEIDVSSPQVNFVDAPTAGQKQTDFGGNWTDTIQDIVPIKINRFAVTNGQFHFRNFHTDPPVNIYAQNIQLTVSNLTNSKELSKTLVADMRGSAVALNSGNIEVEGAIDPYADKPTFDLDFALEGLEVTELNDFLKAYINADAHGGRAFVYLEMKARNGEFQGYVKPLIKELELFEWNEDDDGFLTMLWEGLLAGASELIENHPRDQIGTRVPIRGTLENPDPDITEAILAVLRNAFIEALRMGVEQSLGMVGGTRASAN